VDWLPPGIEREPDAQKAEVGGKKLYDHVAKVIQGRRIPFRLIPHEAESDPETFYMMENKVSNELFALAMNDPDFQKSLADEKKVHSETIKDQWKLGGIGNSDLGMDGKDQWPVLRVTVTEAHLFARWLGGYLPSVAQWDKAGGWLNNDQQPCLPPPWERDDIAINRGEKGPMPVGTAPKDVSRFKCRDMAGDGQEWTATLTQVGKSVPVSNPSDQFFVVLRGNSYVAPQPFLFTDRRASVPYLEPSPYIGFRVVLHLSLGP
jgi:formylglycine-generating enzyme required for sulfatase activity